MILNQIIKFNSNLLFLEAKATAGVCLSLSYKEKAYV